MKKTTRNAAKVRDPFHDFPHADADRCVKCALCLPHCPTYAANRHEGDSPRGRIALLQGLAQGELPVAGRTLAHLDQCLTCRACEPVCPADVPYGKLIDAGRKSLWRAGHRPGWLWRALAFWRRSPRRLAWLTRTLLFVDRVRLARLTARLPLGRLARVAAFVEGTDTPPAAGRYPARTPHGEVALFLGCIARPLDAAVAHAARRVLNAMNYSVTVPAAQTCCGAMDAHAGDAATATVLARTNGAAFAGDFDAIVTTASGCGAQLLEYAQFDDPTGTQLARRTRDVMQFIAIHADRLPALAPRSARVVVHAPCTLRNVMRQSDESGGAPEVLRRIPELSVTPLVYSHCCGAAGSYLFEQPEMADTLGEQLLDALEADPPDVFVTGNIGCALHVRRLARQRGLALQVRHPVELLAAALPPEADV